MIVALLLVAGTATVVSRLIGRPIVGMTGAMRAPANGDQTKQVTGHVRRAAYRTGVAAHQLLDAASGLSRQAEQLSAEIGGFTTQVRAA